MRLQDVKLIIWDLDETLWNGTISEGEVQLIEETVHFIYDTTNMGIVHSICSKNDFEVAKAKLEELSLWDYFVFPSIDWQSKGHRIKNIIDSMALRYVNVLFVDDNIQNLNEAKYYCEGIHTALPEEITVLFEEAKNTEKKDASHKRLRQYKLLQQKDEEKKEFDSNEEFLHSCNIQVELKYDCLENIDRLYELIIRSNQLNFTKIRPTREAFRELLSDIKYKCGYVCVKDRFGDYGIIGFFAQSEDGLKHFVFSCRTLGMRVEQFVYMQLGCPKVDVQGDVVVSLDNTFLPPWINQKTLKNEDTERFGRQEYRILFKGPCDMSQVFSFINENENIIGEFSYTNEQGILTEGHNHTAQIVTALESNEVEKSEIVNQFSWLDKDCLKTDIADEKINFVVLSMLTDGNLGVYRNRKNGRCISLCESHYDITAKKNHQKYIGGEIFTSNIKFTQEDLDLFSETYQYVENSDFELTIDNLTKIRKILPETSVMILILGSEREYQGKVKESYKGRHLVHKKMNEKIVKWAKQYSNVVLVPLDRVIQDNRDFLDTNNHFVKRVYYDLAKEIVGITNMPSDTYKQNSKFTLWYQTFIQRLRIAKRNLVKRIKKH